MSSKREMILHANTVLTICMEICAEWAADPNIAVFADGRVWNRRSSGKLVFEFQIYSGVSGTPVTILEKVV